jgi:S-adenosylmethionine:tRNA ribosyltransferase-isomerase
MKKSDFNFDLPPELIAQTPIESREQSRLLCLDRHTGEIRHRCFYELPRLLRKGDCLVLNDSRVLPARLLGSRETGGAVEIVLLRDVGKSAADTQSETWNTRNGIGNAQGETCKAKQNGGRCVWECLARPGKKVRIGTKLLFGNGELIATVTGETCDGNKHIEFTYNGVFLELLERLGKMPLPPYIREELKDNERYQTVYSRVNGSAAAPTAGLHFTNDLLSDISARGAEVCFVTLHVGLGTFRPVKADIVEEHKMHSEYSVIPGKTAETVNRAKHNGGRVIAVGTTSCRSLEACSDDTGSVCEFSGFTDIFIYPGYDFKCIDGLITNFHLPESTLIMLVSAFAGRESILLAYREAIRERYRFFSFGDAMMIV